MSTLKEKVAYLQGLAEGLNFEKETKEGKFFTAIIEVLETAVSEIDTLTAQQEELESYLEAIDEDLGDLETEIFGEDDCPCCEEDEYDDDYDEDYEDDEDEDVYMEVECPKCHDIVRFETSILADEDVIEVTCPNCDEVVYVNDDQFFMEDDEVEKDI